REIDARQRRYRQQAIGEDPEDDEGAHDERRHHRPPDAEFRQVHDVVSALGNWPAGRGSTRVPGASRNWPSTTTCSPAARPRSTPVPPRSLRPTVTAPTP